MKTAAQREIARIRRQRAAAVVRLQRERAAGIARVRREREAARNAYRATREKAQARREWKRNGGFVGAVLNAVFGLVIPSH